MAEKFDLKIEDGKNVFLTSDSHFFHENIIHFSHRPFNNVDEMNSVMIDNWNSKVPPDGLVFHLGDFAWGGYPKWREIREQLNGEIILIEGNHDRKNLTSTGKLLFSDVVQQMRICIENRPVWLNHFPFLCYSGTYRDFKGLEFQAYGHVHSGHYAGNSGKDSNRLSVCFPTQYDVGVDNNEFAPISWHELNEKIIRQIEEENDKNNDSA
jgi:calcineurin-like phosphoesterase family protein